MKRSCCGCGHVFTLKGKVQVSADKSMGKAVKRRRALEAVEDTLRRQAQNRTRMASMRASETHEQTLQMQNMLEQGPDFWCWFDTTQFSYHCVHPIHAKMFQSKCQSVKLFRGFAL